MRDLPPCPQCHHERNCQAGQPLICLSCAQPIDGQPKDGQIDGRGPLQRKTEFVPKD